MSKAVDTNVFNSANALDVQAPNPCVFGCGAKIRYDVLVLETSSPGGQACSSSCIKNYLGFPTGISGLPCPILLENS